MIFKLLGAAIFVIALCLISVAQKPDLSKKEEDTEDPSLFSILFGSNAWKRWALDDEWRSWETDKFITDPMYSSLACNRYNSANDD